MIRLLEKELLDEETEAHYAYHKTLRTVTGKHSHDFYEFFLVAKGSLFHQINGHREILNEGKLVFIRPNDVHYYQNNGTSEGELLNLAFTSSTLHSLSQYLGDGFDMDNLVTSDVPPSTMIEKHEIDGVKERFQYLTLIQSDEKKKIKTEVRALLAEIFVRYISQNTVIPVSSVPEWLDNLRRKMRQKEHFIEGLSRLYQLSPKSPEHLSRMIKKHFDRTPTEWINEMRLKYAGNLLIHTDQPVIDVSMEVGYQNLSHFYHRFKKYFGSSPAQYRKQHRKIIIPR